jgi:hypothetical protein
MKAYKDIKTGDEKMQARLYFPVKRSIYVQAYHLVSFPYILFLRKECRDGAVLFARWAITDEMKAHTQLYVNPLTNGYTAVCLNNDYHYIQPPDRTMGDLIAEYWSKPFAGLRYGMNPVGGNVRSWKRLSMDEVMAATEKFSPDTYGGLLKVAAGYDGTWMDYDNDYYYDDDYF